MRRALVIGGADCLDADLAPLDPADFDVIIGTNDALYTIPPLDALATLHPERVTGGGPRYRWRERRAARGWPPVPVYTHHPDWTDRDGFCVWRDEDALMRVIWTRGSSGLYAVGVALHALGADTVLLAGCPMDERPNRYRTEPTWRQHGRYWTGWIHAHDRGLLDGVRSMSGRTRELLGAPTDVPGVACGDGPQRAA